MVELSAGIQSLAVNWLNKQICSVGLSVIVESRTTNNWWRNKPVGKIDALHTKAEHSQAPSCTTRID